MNDYTLNKSDFKKYLLAELSDTRQDQLTFWKKGIPLPVDIIYSLFEKRGVLLGKYLDHIGAAYLFAWANRNEGNNFKTLLAAQPSKNNLAKRVEITALFDRNFKASGIGPLLIGFSEQLLLKDYVPQTASMFDAITHQGKKYQRIFIPPLFKKMIRGQFPELLTLAGNKNGDMFANVIADELGIYRSGFGDVLVAYFNKLIEFILVHQSASAGQYASVSPFSLSSEGLPDYQDTALKISRIIDGSLWEPYFHNARTSFLLNSSHPFTDYIQDGREMKEMLVLLINAMAVVEDASLKTQDRKVIEKFRQDVSREVRLMLEKK